MESIIGRNQLGNVVQKMSLGSAHEVENDGKGLDIDNILVIKRLIIAPPILW